jgi:hypothetical protein
MNFFKQYKNEYVIETPCLDEPTENASDAD